MRAVLAAALGGLAGFVAWHQGDSIMHLTWLILLLIAWPQLSRLETWLAFLGYYLVALSDEIWCVQRFFPEAQAWTGALVLIAHALISALPWALLSRTAKTQYSSALLFTTLLSALPPLGFFNILNPTLGAGVLFPGTGVAGLIGLLLIAFGMHRLLQQGRPTPLIIAALSCLTVVWHASLWVAPSAPTGWVAHSTYFGGMYKPGGSSATARYREIDQLTAQSLRDGAKVIAFPESVIPPLSGRTLPPQFLVPRAQAEYQTHPDSLVLIGADIQNDLHASVSRYRSTALRLMEADDPDTLHAAILAYARSPMPVGVWNPALPNSGSMAFRELFRGHTLRVDGKQTAVLFCYEEMLLYPLLFDALAGAEVVIILSNQWTGRGLHEEYQQAMASQAMTRLFALPYIRATNL